MARTLGIVTIGQAPRDDIATCSPPMRPPAPR